MRGAWRRMALLFVGFVVLTGCSDAFGIDDVLGMWEATHMNGMSVPGTAEYYNTPTHKVTVEVQYLRLEFHDGGSYTQWGSMNGLETESEGTYTVDLEAQTLTMGIAWGTFVDDELTLSIPGGATNVYVYRRE